MHSRFRTKGVLLAALIALVAGMTLPHSASAEPEPGAKKKGFRLFARALGAMTINRVYCGLASDGQICVDSTNSSTIGGGFWPKGTADQYVFNSGLQVAGIIQGGPWNGDTVGGFFFDPKGTTQHGEEVEPIYNSANPADLEAWPEAACVPYNPTNPNDESAALFDQLLQTDPTSTGYSFPCRKSASQGDIWFVSWEGNPALRAGRKHPLGVLVETRGMGWNFPSGNEDILYFIYTFYNVTSTNAADYASYRPSLRPILLQKANDLHAAAAATGVTLPEGGYTMTNLFAAFARDDDVATASANYSSVNLPFALGYTYDHGFSATTPGWKFDPSIFSAPFFPGAGFTGAKYLKSPTGAGEIQLFSNTINGQPFPGAVNDPRDVVQLYRYLSGTLSPSTGDQACNTGIQATTRICFINNTQSQDMRFFQSSTPLLLPPGGSGSIVVAYIFAPPVRVAGGVNNTDVKPGDPRRLTNPVTLATGANLIDSMTGFLGWTDAPPGGNGDGIVQQGEFSVVSKSLLGKARTAQQVFDFKFLLPFAPSSPEFFLVPGDDQVTVLWKPSLSETTGDPFFDIASLASVPDPVTQLPTANTLYDPNYRKFDVEGYRVYRGRVDAPNELVLLAQFDYSGTVIFDYTGTVNPGPTCAPELAIVSSGCTTLAPNRKNGTALVNRRSFDLVGEIIQTNAGSGRVALASGLAQILSADTAVNGGGTNGPCGPRSTCPKLDNSGVPFVFVDHTPRNNFRYFYSVTAFDVNSIESGPTTLESPRNTKSVRPVKPSSNYATSGQVLTTEMVGRGQVLNPSAPLPTLKQDGTFSGPFPPSNAWGIGLGAFVSELLAQPGALSATLDSIVLGAAYADIPHRYFFTAVAGTDTARFNVGLEQPEEIGVTTGATQFRAVPVDNALAGQFGGDNQFKLPGQVTLRSPGPDYLTLWGRGCVNARSGFDGGTGCDYNGSRWYSGANETVGTPIACLPVNFSNNLQTCFNTAGTLTGVTTINQNLCYWSAPGNGCRQMTGVTSGAARAGDFRVYWGNAGHVDSVIDLTHNVVVPGPETVVNGGTPYARKVSASWGILNPGAVAGNGADGNALLTNRDFACVEPFKTLAQGTFTCPAAAGPFTLSATAVPGAVGFFGGAGTAYPPSAASPISAAPGGGAGFVMYMVGDMFTFELAGGALPAAGTTWTLRRYVGGISGGSGGTAGDEGAYEFSNPEGVLPLTAIGVQLRTTYTASNTIAASKFADLKRVHTVPDPYYVTNSFEQSTDNKIIKFVNLPTKAIIRIYSSSGVLVSLLEHPGANCQNVNLSGVPDNPIGGECTWNVRNRNNQVVASGVYFYHIEANTGGGTARRVGRMTIVNFAQ